MFRGGNCRERWREPSDLIWGHQRTQLLFVAAKLAIADHLAGGPRAVDALARMTGTDRPSLYWLLRALAGHGVFAERDDGRFELTPLAELLRSGTPGSLRAMALAEGGDYYVLATVLHDWGDERAIETLRQCRQAMATEAKLLVIERVMPLGKQFFRLDELLPVVQVLRRQAAPVLHQLQQQPANGGPIDRVVEEDTAGSQNTPNLRQHLVEVRDVFEDIAAGDERERGVLEGEVFADSDLIPDREARLVSMGLCGRDRGGGGVKPGDLTAETCELLGQEAATTAYVEEWLAPWVHLQLLRQD